MTAKEFLKEKGIHPAEPIYWTLQDKIIMLDELMEEFHSEKLKLPKNVTHCYIPNGYVVLSGRIYIDKHGRRSTGKPHLHSNGVDITYIARMDDFNSNE